MNALVDLLGIDPSLREGIDQIEIVKVDLYKDKSMMKFILRGLETLTAPGRLAAVILDAGKKYDVDVKIVFDDADTIGAGSAFDILLPYILHMVSRSEDPSYSYADCLTYSLAGDTVYVSSDLSEELCSSADITKSAGTVAEMFSNMAGITGIKTEVVPSAQDDNVIYDEGDIVIPSDDPEDYYSVIPMPNIPKEILEQSHKKESEQTQKEDKKEKPSGDSWKSKAKQVQEEFKANNSEDGSFRFSGNAEALFGRVKKDVMTIDIGKFTLDERLINVKGSITLTDDLKLSKSGKVVIAKFYIVDETGGLSAVMFVKPEEADEFEKKFKKGGYAGFQGEPHSDYGEPGLKVTGIFEVDKPSGRKDYAEVKRVELHVHTKMSEKDAISAPSDLIKLAASFGHKACAVTDHGVVQAFPEAYNTAKGLKVNGTDEPFKTILGCEGYLVEDGPTVFYNLPFNREETKAVGSIVALSIRTTGDDSCEDRITAVAAAKFRLKGYRPLRPDIEGESDEDAKNFSQMDIDTSLWDPSEIPENLRDEAIKVADKAHKDTSDHVINIHLADIPNYTDSDTEEVPGELVYEHVADFYAEVEDIIYPGTGEPCDSYFRMGELVKFIGDSYITGKDIFYILDFLRRAGFGINIEDHVYYRHKFLMPAISVDDIQRYVYPECRKMSVRETLNALGAGDILEYHAGTDDNKDDMLMECYDVASLVVHYLTDSQSADPVELNKRVGHYDLEEIKGRKNKAFHIIYLVRNNLGLYNLYRLISEAHVNYFSFRPRTPKSLLRYYASSIIVGGACESGEIYKCVMRLYKSCGKNVEQARKAICESEELQDILRKYDYVEVQPLCNNMFLTRKPPEDSDTGPVTLDVNDIRIVNELLVFTADQYKMPCVATTDSHFLEKKDGMYRKFLLHDQNFSDADMQTDLYFRTTQEMLDEFSYLGPEKAYEIVVTNTNMIADKIEYGIKPFPDGTYPPIISRAAADVRDIAYTRANKLYRHNGVLNEVVKARLEKELNSIIGNGFAIMYYIAYRLVKKSNNDGYIVGSRGSVGSSFVATMCGISEVNPLVPHYRCPKCNLVEFNNTGEFGSGFDMPVKNCPDCGVQMQKDGQDIPFETFLGFFGDKQPDIDLNFSSDYQPRAHKYVEFLFGKTHTFRAGTIGTYADKNAVAVARKYGEDKGLTYSKAMLYYLSEGIIGVKRTTSQHPGGIVVVPKEMDVYEFTPIQCPANNMKCGIITTHFDFRAMHDTILKLDILGHADPTVLRMLHELTGVEITGIPIPDDKVMSLLKTTDALGFPMEATEAGAATLGLSELGTNMARGMIKETQPSHFYDLVQLMGLSHGTDVWTGNAQDLIRNGTCDLNTVIGCRDSIMTRLIYWGLPNKDSFDIMEKVRKGKGLTPEHEQLMRDNGVPDWYIDSCKKIKYMFPKAHAAAYSISSLRVAWFKVYYPEEYYCAFFTIRGDEFDAQYMCRGEEVLKARRELLAEMMHQEDNPKIKSEYYLCEIVEEMYHRGISFVPIDLKTSDAVRFTKVDKGLIRPPLDIIESFSSGMAKALTKARDEAPFKNREDLLQRSGIGKSALQTLVDYGLCEDLPESAQIDLFSLMGI